MKSNSGERSPIAGKFKKYLVTAALPYANGKIHLGHLAGAYLPADIYVRYLRSMKRDTVFVCGSDEHGVPITITAEEEKITPQAVVDRYHSLNRAAFEKFGMSFDNYSRTSLPLHHETASEFFVKLHKAAILRDKKEKQLYDEKARMFLPDRYVEGTCPKCGNPEARGDQCEKCGSFLSPLELINPRSKITGETPTVRETTHAYFPLGSYQARLERYVNDANERDGWKDNVLQYCRSWFKDGLQDRAVTRDLSWGVKVPLKGYEDKVLYVWFDAVLGYISSTKEWAIKKGAPDKWREYWLDPSTKYVAFIGKDNVVFHCIVFPAMLMAWNEQSKEQYILPENVPANEFLNFQGEKFSKSRRWGIDADEFLEEFPSDVLRYALTMNMPESRDADFTWKDFQARTNNELADILGNFVNRTLTFVHRNFGGAVPEPEERTSWDPMAVHMLDHIANAVESAGSLIEHYQFRDATLTIMNLARYANKYFDSSEPWRMVKENPKRCATTMNISLQTIRSLAIFLEPIIPSAAVRMWKMLNLPGTPTESGWQSAGIPELKAGHQLGKPEILFAKIEDEVIQKQIDRLAGPSAVPNAETGAERHGAKSQMALQATGAHSTPGPTRSNSFIWRAGGQVKPAISIDGFRQIDLRVAKVLRAERVPKSEKLLKIQVSLGGEERQVIAGIAQHYKPEDLIGKKIVVVANLPPAKLMGQESQAMLLAASDSDGKLAILTVAGEIDEGSIVK
ncbi:MAG TPA: methionine--tRNA ligase [Bacteroidota bacterium]|nr:methionine--tRNA ligase [Bacteroidota bacterium]